MKINGPNQTNFNPYKNQIQKQMDIKKTAKQDQLQISSEALKLQENTKVSAKREAYVQEIKNRIDSGDYQIDFEKTAKNMLAFWSDKKA